MPPLYDPSTCMGKQIVIFDKALLGGKEDCKPDQTVAAVNGSVKHVLKIL